MNVLVRSTAYLAVFFPHLTALCHPICMVLKLRSGLLGLSASIVAAAKSLSAKTGLEVPGICGSLSTGFS